MRLQCTVYLKRKKGFIAVHVYCTLVVVAHSTGTFSVPYMQSSAIYLHGNVSKLQMTMVVLMRMVL